MTSSCSCENLHAESCHGTTVEVDFSDNVLTIEGAAFLKNTRMGKLDQHTP